MLQLNWNLFVKVKGGNMKLYLIRHGQTDWNLRKKIQGSIDIELNETGLKQAEEMSSKFIEMNYKIDKIYCSKQKRALKTAEILSNHTNTDYYPVEGLEEINLGEWQGLSWAEVENKYPEEFNQWLQNRRYINPPKGESYEELLKRSLNAIHKIISENNDDVAIVTHNAVIMCIQCFITNTPFEEMDKFVAKNTSIVEIDSKFLANTL